jgi:hypothetical protein
MTNRQYTRAMKPQIVWRELEEGIGIEALPAFHRRFLAARGIENPDALALRRVQQNVERELNKLVLESKASKTGDTWLVDSDVIEGLV